MLFIILKISVLVLVLWFLSLVWVLFGRSCLCDLGYLFLLFWWIVLVRVCILWCCMDVMLFILWSSVFCIVLGWLWMLGCGC